MATSLPVTVVAGYLGAGKTTLINRLLRDPGGRRLGVMVNDFGALAIDTELIESSRDGVVTLANGCVCCSAGGEFFAAMSRILDHREAFDHLLIEASGVARPSRLADLARAEPDLQLDCVITLIDAENHAAHSGDELIADCLHDQVRAADLLLLNKCDLVRASSLSSLEARLRAQRADASILRCTRAQVPPEVLMAERVSNDVAAPSTNPVSHESHYTRWSFQAEGCFQRARLEQVLGEFPANVMRIKGVVSVCGEGEMAIHRVGRRITTDSVPPGTRSGNRLIAIALGEIPAGEMTQSLLGARCE